jgi:hypothetical protein
MSLAVYQDVQLSSITCIIMMSGGCATNIMSALYDHAKQYDNEHVCHENGTMEVACQYISEWLWKCHNR